MSDVVELTLPAGSDLIVLARFTAVTLGSRAGFDIEEIEDLRLAVDELCLSVLAGAGTGVLRVEFVREDSSITITCAREGGELEYADVRAADVEDLSTRLIMSLADEHERQLKNGRRTAWLSKRGSRVLH